MLHGLEEISANGPVGPFPYAACRPIGWLFSADYDTLGTCLLIHPEWILTCAHVIGRALDASDFVAAFDFTRGVRPGDRITRAFRADAASFQSGAVPLDFAVVRLRTPVQAPISPFPLPNSTDPVGAAGIVCIQHPDANQSWKSVSTGHVGAVAAPSFTHDASTSGGSSGAPIFDLQQRLVGIHTGENDVAGSLRAVSANAIRAALRQSANPLVVALA